MDRRSFLKALSFLGLALPFLKPADKPEKISRVETDEITFMLPGSPRGVHFSFAGKDDSQPIVFLATYDSNGGVTWRYAERGLAEC